MSTERSDPTPPFLAGARNRLGLAAGFDRDGTGLAVNAATGFGFLEIGTVVPGDEPVAMAIAERVAAFRGGVPVGVSIGSATDGYGGAVLQDYVAGLHRFAPLADYVALNLSSRRHPLRQDYAAPEAAHFLMALAAEWQRLARRGRVAPMVPKLLLNAAWPHLAPFFRRGPFPAVIGVGDNEAALAAALATLDGLPVISVGGIASAEDARARLARGAAFLQIHREYADRGAAAVREIVGGFTQAAATASRKAEPHPAGPSP